MHNYHNPYVSHWYNNTRYRTKWGAAQAALSDGVPVNFIFDKIKITDVGQMKIISRGMWLTKLEELGLRSCNS